MSLVKKCLKVGDAPYVDEGDDCFTAPIHPIECNVLLS